MSDTRPDDGAVETPDDAETPEPENGRSAVFEAITGAGEGWRSALLVPLLALLTALIVGAIILAVSDLEFWRTFGDSPGTAFGDAWDDIRAAYAALWNGAFGDLQGVSETLTLAAPLILAGLAVAIGFRAGLFNIGAEGQMLAGGMFAVYVGFTIDPTRLLGEAFGGLVHVLLAIAAAFIGGALWGAIPGWLRARTGAHEVITTIMLNFVALRGVDFLLKNSLFQDPGRTDPISKPILDSAHLPRLFQAFDRWFDRIVPWSMNWSERVDLRLHAGILIALVAAYVVYWVLFKSSVGFEFRAVGSNPDAAKYAGMNVTKLTVGVMAFAGALAGLAGTAPIMGIQGRALPGFSSNVGFDAIALALLGRSHPLGVVLAGILFGALRSGGQEMQAATSISIDLVTVVGALIVMFIAAPALIRAIYRVKTGEESASVTKGWAT
jgi:simple sugar transport system permease protein